jgi:hypothetical protein
VPAIRAVLPLSNGDLVLGGSFTRLGDQAFRHIGRVQANGTPY